MILLVVESITWIKVEKPAFDLVGLILGALNLTGALAAAALVLGVLLGAAFIRRRAQERPGSTSLHLDPTPGA